METQIWERVDSEKPDCKIIFYHAQNFLFTLIHLNKFDLLFDNLKVSFMGMKERKLAKKNR